MRPDWQRRAKLGPQLCTVERIIGLTGVSNSPMALGTVKTSSLVPSASYPIVYRACVAPLMESCARECDDWLQIECLYDVRF